MAAKLRAPPLEEEARDARAAACHRVKTVSTGWQANTATAPDDHPAAKSTAQSGRRRRGGAADPFDDMSMCVLVCGTKEEKRDNFGTVYAISYTNRSSTASFQRARRVSLKQDTSTDCESTIPSSKIWNFA